MADLDIIIPLYKSRDHLDSLIDKLNEWNAAQNLEIQVIFVDDGSQDGTYEQLIQKISKAEFDIHPIQLAKNYGQHTAISIGLHYSKAHFIATMDDDLQHDPFQINLMLETLSKEDADLVFGMYGKRKHNLIRKIGSNLLKKILLTSGSDYSNTSSFRLMKSNVIEIFKTKHLSVVLLEEYLIKYSSNIQTCQIKHEERKHGNSTYSSWKLLKMAMQIMLFHSSIPLKLITRFGLILSIAFFGMGCYFIYNKMIHNVPLGFTSLIVAIFFSTGLLLLSLGIIGEYIRKIWISQNQLDQVIVLKK
jgi:glycosyltransferase involved in cell wall biosynthesis